ncbi:MAG: hypothetical protein WCN98_08560 [Verrucomicrobiaceae bacterium]
MLFDQSQAQILNEMLATTEANELMARVKGEENALALLEKEKSRLAAEEKAIKRRIGDLFAGRA